MSDSLLSVCVLCLLALSSACYIQNCPRGGKRSQLEPVRQCQPCGPGLQGRCFGPSICCGASVGCLMSTADTQVCVEESARAGACEPGGAHCGDQGGRCAAPGICCSAESCSVDPLCSDAVLDPDLENAADLRSVSEDVLLHLLNLASRRHRF